MPVSCIHRARGDRVTDKVTALRALQLYYVYNPISNPPDKPAGGLKICFLNYIIIYSLNKTIT